MFLKLVFNKYIWKHMFTDKNGWTTLTNSSFSIIIYNYRNKICLNQVKGLFLFFIAKIKFVYYWPPCCLFILSTNWAKQSLECFIIHKKKKNKLNINLLSGQRIIFGDTTFAVIIVWSQLHSGLEKNIEGGFISLWF